MDRFNETWWKCVGHKKMTQIDNRPGSGCITEKQPFLRLAEKCFFGQKCVSFQKKHPKYPKRLIFTLEKGTFFFEQFFQKVFLNWLNDYVNNIKQNALIKGRREHPLCCPVTVPSG